MSSMIDRSRELFLQALEIDAPDERRRFLESRCDGDDALRRRVEQLLDAYFSDGQFLEESPWTPERVRSAANIQWLCNNSAPLGDMTNWIGRDIGPYRLVELLGAGGMGLVFRAEQTSGVRREVALKLVRPGSDSRQILARFQAERQALAMMDHPNVAHVLDAGTTDEGLPYFVMELVRGEPITQFCDQRQLSIRERLELLIPVCQAVQHAHQKGIIHRDLKPSNVLVSQVDGELSAKVIDFGVAKLLDRSDWQQTLATEVGQVLGTLPYMSPEQAGLTPDIDSRTDVYSLGVLAYELLTGTTPLDADRLGSVAVAEVLRQVREEEPPTPAIRIARQTGRLDEVSGVRHTDAGRWASQLRGDVSWIVMKALEKDRARRYDSPAQLAADLRRWLDDEPIEARPPSAIYKLQKFARKHRAAVVLTGLLLMLLVAATVGSTSLAVWALRAQHLADARLGAVIEERRQADAARLEAERARETAEQAEQETSEAFDFLMDMISSPDPYQEGRAITVLELLDRVVEQLEGRFEEKAGRRYNLLWRLAGTYTALGEPLKALHILEKIDVDVVLESPFITQMNLSKALALTQLGRHREALELRRRAYAAHLEDFGEDDRRTIDAREHLVSSLIDNRQYEEALPLAEENYQAHLQAKGTADVQTLHAGQNLAVVLRGVGRREEALALNREGLERVRQSLGERHPEYARGLHNYSTSLLDAGRLEEALEAIGEAYRLRRELLGETHYLTLRTGTQLALQMLRSRPSDQWQPAVDLLEEVLDIAGQTPVVDPFVVDALNGLARVYQDRHEPDREIPYRRRALEVLQQIRETDHQQTMTAEYNLALALQRGGEHEEAIAILEDLYRRRVDVLGALHERTLNALHCWAVSLDGLDRHGEAIELFEQALEGRREKHGPDAPDTRRSQLGLARALIHAGEVDRGLAMARQLIYAQISQSPNSVSPMRFLDTTIRALERVNRHDEIEPLQTEIMDAINARRQTGVEGWEASHARNGEK